MNIPQQRTMYAGIALIVLGVLYITGLASILPAIVLAGGGAFLYTNQRKRGQLDQALIGGLWGVGLALIWFTGAWVPGLLVLGGLTLLMRGREQQTDAKVQRLVVQSQAAFQQISGQARTALQARSARRSTSATPSQPNSVTIINADTPTTGDTTRLH
jgi:hypothetical protein